MPRRREAGISGAAQIAGVLPFSALDERLAIVGTSGSGKTYAAKGWVERLLDTGARVCVVDPLGVWWGLRARANPQDFAGADSAAAGYPVVVFGGRHADIALDEGVGAALGRLIGMGQLACVVDLSELGSSAARRRSWRHSRRRCTTPTRSRCTSCWTRPTFGRLSVRNLTPPCCSAASRRSSAAVACAASSPGSSPSVRPSCTRMS